MKTKDAEEAAAFCAMKRKEWVDSIPMKEKFLAAARDGDIATVIKYLQEGNVHIDCRDNCFNTAFIVACRQGHIPLAVALIEAGCDYSLKDDDHATGLYYCKKQHPLKVKDIQVIPIHLPHRVM